MIGKIATGRSFSGCMQYLHDGRLQETEEQQKIEREKKQAQVIHYNKCFGTKKELIRQFIEVSKLNPKVSKPVFHASISLAHQDAGKLSIQDKIDIAQQLARQFDFENKQYVVITHKDTEHEHLHIVANRIGYDGPTASDSNSYKRMAEFSRAMELKHELTKVLSPNKFLRPEQRVEQSQRIDQRKEKVKQHLTQAIKQSKNVKEVARYMEKQGYKVELGRGIAFRDAQQVYFKGSQLGYSLMEIEKKIRQEQKQQLDQKLQQERDRQVKSLLKVEKENNQERKQSRGLSL